MSSWYPASCGCCSWFVETERARVKNVLHALSDYFPHINTSRRVGLSYSIWRHQHTKEVQSPDAYFRLIPGLGRTQSRSTFQAATPEKIIQDAKFISWSRSLPWPYVHDPDQCSSSSAEIFSANWLSSHEIQSQRGSELSEDVNPRWFLN